MTLDQLEERRRRSHRLKLYAIIEVSLLVGCVLLLAFVGHVPVWLDVAVGALGCYGSYSLYRVGGRFESRWDQLIREKSDAPP